MAPSALHEMRKNLFAVDPSLHDFPKPLESSSISSVAMFDRPNKEVQELHQRMRSHYRLDQQLETAALGLPELNHFAASSHALASNCDFP